MESSANPFRFQCQFSVVLAAGLIKDTVGNPFSGAGWSYTKNSAIIGATLSSAAVADICKKGDGPRSLAVSFL